jgi:hypothetical protein
VVSGSEERREASAGVEARESEPVDGPVAPHQRGPLAVADEGVVFDTECHGGANGFQVVLTPDEIP